MAMKIPIKTLRIAAMALAAAGVLAIGSTHAADSADGEGAQKAVLVTGASTGLGRRIAETLASNGYYVYAGARKEKDLEELNKIDNVQSIRLDVTIQAEIDAAVEMIRKEGRGLYGLVNNAGVLILGPLIEVDEDDMDFLFDVNIYGPYRVTKAFAPLIVESAGRITTIGSISGILSGPLAGPYSMSKHAIEAYTDSLSREMERVNVKVSVIEPGNYESEIGATLRKKLKERDESFEGSLFEKELTGWLAREPSEDKDPQEVADAVMHALFDPAPKLRYMVVPNEEQAQITIRKAMQEMVQLNEGQPYAYDRDALIAMLDELLAESRGKTTVEE
jgi:NAD(P)-dependent dehydrogenase (short-subunit alcohol dehydrogenase family)